MSRAKNLGVDDISQIVGMLDGWTGKLTWDLLVDSIERRLYTRYTRQALDKHQPIKKAFATRKDSVSTAGASGERPTTGSPELDVALQRITRLEGGNERLAAENQLLLEKFARWAYNAHTHGLAEALLDQDLPPVDRDRTERPRLAIVRK